MLFWSNSNSALASVPMIAMSKASELFKDTYTAGTITSKTGKVDIDLNTFTNKVFADTLKKYAGPKVNMDLLDKYPGAVNGFALFSFDPRCSFPYWILWVLCKLPTSFYKTKALLLEDITEASTGDFAVCFPILPCEQKETEGEICNALRQFHY